MESIQLIELNPANPAHLDQVATHWSLACGPDFLITPRFVEFNLRHSTGAVRSGRLAVAGEKVLGFVIASADLEGPDHDSWIDAIAVAPPYQRQGIGSCLLDWAHAWLKGEGCSHIDLGGSLRPFTPGLPVQLNPEPFVKMGYEELYQVCDLSASLEGYQSMAKNPDPPAQVRPMQAGEENILLDFMGCEFAGRWHYEFMENLREMRRLSDWLLLWIDGALQGFCIATYEDSTAPLERFYPQRLPHPWGQVGTYGVAEALRGKHYGLYLIDSSLVHLCAQGVKGCVIDWTVFLDLYRRFGFKLYNQYHMLRKELS